MTLEESSSFGSFSNDTSMSTHSSEADTNIEGNNSQVEGDNSPSTLILGKRKRTAKCWEHFNIEQHSSGKLLGTCKHCNKASYDASSRNGTSNFTRHLDSCEKYKEFLANQTPSGSGKQIVQSVYRELLAEAILRHGYSFSWVEHEGNRKIHKYLNEDVQPISRNTAKKVCFQIHGSLKEKIKKVLCEIPGRICLTSDLWTACTSRGYLCITAHYIDQDWKLHSKLLCFRHCPPPHGGEELSHQIDEVIMDWGISKKLFSLTVDNASNMDKMISDLKQSYNENLLCWGKHFHIRCCAHILNLIVKNGLKVIDGCVLKVREGVKYIDGSESRMQKFHEYVVKYKVPFSCGLWMDVPTRWNSTYIMLDRALKYRHILNSYFSTIDGGFKYALNYVEWGKVEKICNLLEPFYEITNLFSGSDYPTASLYFPHVWRIHIRLLKAELCGDTDISGVAIEMLHKFRKYWDEYVMVLSFAAVFDPRYKFEFVDFSLKKIHGDIEGGRKASEIRIQFDELYKEYEKIAGIIPQIREQVGIQASDDFGEYASYTRVGSSKNEMDRYLREPVLDMYDNIDVLNFWKENTIRFPILSSMARDVLAIPITTVASESTFSMGGRILNKWRSSLLPRNVDALVTSKHWLTGYDDFKEEGVPVNVSSLSDDEENE